MLKPILLFLAALAPAGAVEIRVATFNVGAHFTQSSGGVYYPEFGLGDPGTPDHETVKQILARIDADVVALQEIDSADMSGSPNDVAALAASLAYPYVHVATYSASGGLSGSFDTDLRVAFLSRFPYLLASEIRSPAGAKELTRLPAVVKVDVPGTDRDPVLVTAHLKPGGSTDRFRRGVELKRIAAHVAGMGLTGNDNFIVTGDFNLNPNYGNTTYQSLPSSLPSTYVLGADFPFPITYSTNPLSYFPPAGVTLLDPRQTNGSPVTFPGGNGYALDVMLVSPALAGRPHAEEVYNSALDTSNSIGLPKAGSPLASSTSATASDHFAVFADLELDQDYSDLGLALSAQVVRESDPPGTASLTVILPEPAVSNVTVDFVSDDPRAVPQQASLVIPAGQSSATTGIVTTRDFLPSGSGAVTFSATTGGFDGAEAILNVLDVDGPYVFTVAGETVAENFDGFDGAHDPASWSTAGGGWTGIDDGSSPLSGARAYGEGNEVAFGFLPGASGMVAEARFINSSGTTLTMLDVAYQVEQWRAVSGGSEDTIEVALVKDGGILPLPDLAFTASTTLPTGPVPGGAATARMLRVHGLSVAADEEFTLRFTFTPGPGSGALPADVFVNEFHYDNDSTDSGEFVEIAVGPGFAGNPAEVELVLYNGSNGEVYDAGQHFLSSFTEGATTASGHRLFSKLIAGIQNGSPDGFAVTVNGVVTSFLSYEGSFTASNGPANGMTSTDIGVAQGTSEPVGTNALGLSGSGGSAADFSWMKFTGVEHSRGQPNQGQSFILPGLPAQGLAIDDLSVTFVADRDLDGLADDEDPDDDNDGMADGDEIAFGTDPLDAGSVFRVELVTTPDGFALAFPGAAGVTYTIEWCDDLESWDHSAEVPGEGAPAVFVLPETGRLFARIRAGG
ncbi:endonuclease/exonuclease/phosphatase family protein [Luteolibacter marinus]|uniref:endonuclease/exonuclease/phosphatase family protein n=1 Tax=Luteolibacter marinus TaxID=2776705 RepID=UPI001866BF8A|nr:endonuclease/exonuclease/phosphatase family protein [Luteolibacter marinus]